MSRGARRSESAIDDSSFTIYAHPGDDHARTAAAQLEAAIESKSSNAAVQQVQLEFPGGGCTGCGIYFGPSSSVELLRAGEAAGQGLNSELPKVLVDMCSRKSLQQDPLLKAIGSKVRFVRSRKDATR